MPITAVARTKLYIGQPLASKTTDFVVADFDQISWDEVGWIENLGSIGDESAEITFSTIGEGRTMKLKGVKNAGSMAVVLGSDYANAGQDAVRAAEASPLDYAFKLEFNDIPSGGTTPSARYFIAKVMSQREQFDTVNNVIRMQAALGVNSNIVRVDAA
jgi:hypothetical protein